jgi:hypothetical protein
LNCPNFSHRPQKRTEKLILLRAGFTCPKYIYFSFSNCVESIVNSYIHTYNIFEWFRHFTGFNSLVRPQRVRYPEFVPRHSHVSKKTTTHGSRNGSKSVIRPFNGIEKKKWNVIVINRVLIFSRSFCVEGACCWSGQWFIVLNDIGVNIFWFSLMRFLARCWKSWHLIGPEPTNGLFRTSSCGKNVLLAVCRKIPSTATSPCLYSYL